MARRIKSFEILGHSVSIEYVKNPDSSGDAIGVFLPEDNRILIKNNLTKKQAGHTLYHEIVHCILLYMGEIKLYNNEKFVDLFAGLLHQILETMKT